MKVIQGAQGLAEVRQLQGQLCDSHQEVLQVLEMYFS